MRVKWLARALINLDEEAEFIAQDNAEAARRTMLKVWQAAQSLADFPNLGRPGRVYGTRELVVPNTPYIVPYRVRKDTVEILRVFHEARKWPDKFST